MSSPIERYNVTAGRPYTTRDGETKKKWINVGRATQWDDGGISLEMDAIPVGGWWDGKLSLFLEKKDEKRTPQQKVAEPADLEDYGIPFG